ncbi:MAG: hypothetical protein C5B58_14390 [Acidobacteria bacterium]|nr:MAG: hypothetical protein C5B58_14390 [Acidobacteriota bacterium]
MLISIKVDLALVRAKLPLRGLADVTLKWGDEELTIRRCAVFQKDGQPPWASLPRLPIGKNGTKKYVPVIELPSELNKRVLEEILTCYGGQRDAN